MLTHFMITKESFIVCAIFIAITLACYGLRVVVNIFTRKKIQERWYLVVVLFGAVGFVLGSFGFAPIIYTIIDVAKYLLGIIASLIP
jgi:predicted permease